MTLVSRGSALAVLQAELTARALRTRWPDLDVTLATRTSAGDRDSRVALWTAADKGLFTADLSEMVASGEADAAVHSWKDLPIESHPRTEIAATLERADPRDVLLVRRDVVERRSETLTVLSSSPRRAWQIRRSAPKLLPWRVTRVEIREVRGNIPTRLAKLVNGEADALIVAKAALDRLLSADAPADVTADVRARLDRCRWMVLPLKEHPTAPAQGALAIEIARNRPEIETRIGAINHAATFRAVQRERAILQSFGGGCHEAMGATVLVRDYGEIVSVRARLTDDSSVEQWTLNSDTRQPLPHSADRIWPRRDERDFSRRRMLDVPEPGGRDGLFVTRTEALPAGWQLTDRHLVWVSGLQTWQRLAQRGVWVHGGNDSLGDAEAPSVNTLAGHAVAWQRLTHQGSGDPEALATYVVERQLPRDLAERTHFFWTSATAFLEALAAHPSIRGGWHSSGPGRTARVIRENVESGHATVWLDYDQWHQNVSS